MPTGEMLGAHYRIERELGHGGMATVYLCTDTRNGSTVAVKVLRPELGSVVTKERFFREIAFSADLDHPRIPRVIESGMIGELPYYAMNFVDGESLRERMKRDPHFTVEEVARIATKIIEPMSFAHSKGIVHRDIKPENVLLHGDEVHVLDFGVARAIIGSAGERLTRTGITVGTPAYMSPEQVTADRDLDLRSDIYSLGCVVYEMLAGTPPFRGGNAQILMAARFTTPPRPLRNFRPDIPETMERAVASAMQKEPKDRWQSADDFAAALALGTATGTHEGAPGEPAMIDKLRATFAESYRVEEEMKGGGMARLFLATDLALNRKVVIKILPPELVSQMMLARFRRESEVTARLQHPHILPVISAGVRDGLVHYIMPFIDGESLRAMLERQGRFSIPQALRILREVTDALAYAHKQGIIHRDIKPENILIQDGHAVLADFGIAAALSGDGQEGEGRLTGTGMSLGTVGYMAPEQALGEKTVDARADIYAVGVVGYEIFAGAAPFTGATDQAILVAHLTKEAPHLDDIRADTPEPVAEAIRKAMQKDPALRFQDAGEFRDALDVASGTPTRATSAFPGMRRLKRLSTKAKAAAGVAAFAVMAAAGYFVAKGGSTPGPGDTVMIAIAPFNTLSSGLSLWREGMVDVLARNLDGAGPLRTVSPTVAIKGFTGTADKTTATQLAKRTRAQYAIFGNLHGSAGDSVTVRGMLVNASNNEEFEIELSDSTAEAAAGRFTIAVINELAKTHQIGASDVRQSSLGSSSIAAVRAFLQGEQFFRRTSWDSAATAYGRAISFDGNFAIALRRAAQVAGWQVNGSDSAARAMWLRAGAQNRGLSPRDSLLIASDSLSAALAVLRSDSMDWPKLTRLFTTVNDAATRYRDDPEVWFAVGEARFHLGYGSPANITERETLDAFDRAIELDSAFAPAYVHAIELAFNLDGAAAGQRYTKAYLQLKPTDDEAEGIAIVDRVATDAASDTDAELDRVSSDAIMAAYFTLRRWPDPQQTALRLLQTLGRRPRDSPTYAADSARMWNFLPLQLAYRGKMAEAHRVMGNRPSRLFVEMALIGGIPADSASQVIGDWVARGIPQAFFALPWLGQQADSARLRILMARADSAARTGSEFSRRGARYRAAAARAYLSLARRDTADAVARFTALPDTLCIACYADRLVAARLLAARNRLADADALLGQRLNSLLTPLEVLIAFERGKVAARLGNREEAVESYRLVADAWAPGDAPVQRYVTEARSELTELRGRNQARK
jgi:serine/threonine-protein kinase